jgi:hypothetical protein
MATPTSTTKKTATAAPRRPAGSTTTGAAPAGQARQTSLQQHLTVIAECDVLTPEGFYAWSESMRALTTAMAFFTNAAATQFDRAARKGAKDNVDGRMTLAQKIEMQRVLRRIGKQLDGNAADSLLTTAKAVVTSYGLLQDFLDNLDSDSTSRPHRNSNGSFNPFGGK